MKVVDLPHDPVFVSQLFEKVELKIGEQHHVNTTALRRMVPPMRQGGLFVLLARRVSDRAHLFSRGVRHVRQILNPLRDIRHALNRRDVHAEAPEPPGESSDHHSPSGSHAPAW